MYTHKIPSLVLPFIISPCSIHSFIGIIWAIFLFLYVFRDKWYVSMGLESSGLFISISGICQECMAIPHT